MCVYMYIYMYIYMFVCMCVYNLVIHSSGDGHLSYFHLMAIMSSAAMNICIRCAFESSFLLLLGI